MFEVWDNKYNHIFVTGPQRSGTRIAAHIIARDLNYRFVDEQQFYIQDVEKLQSILVEEKLVVQCPAICHLIHSIATENDLVVLMIRDLESIFESQKRINWQKEKSELLKYNRSEGRAAEVKYAFWLTFQRIRTFHWYELNYRDLYSHPFFITKFERMNFKPDQWQRNHENK